jgi:hypothetical protein
VIVPNSTAGMIIGKGGAYVKQIKEPSVVGSENNITVAALISGHHLVTTARSSLLGSHT